VSRQTVIEAIKRLHDKQRISAGEMQRLIADQERKEREDSRLESIRFWEESVRNWRNTLNEAVDVARELQGSPYERFAWNHVDAIISQWNNACDTLAIYQREEDVA